MTEQQKNRNLLFLICLLLIALIWAVFGQALRYGFINCDDDFFIYNNPAVLSPTADGAVKVLTRTDEKFYYPLTVLSFMGDVLVHGVQPAGFHLTNILLHSASVLLLFSVLFRMTASVWRSAFVAAVFSVHPLRVESVVWITERKDVLSGLFFMLSLHAYVSYVRHRFSLSRYGLLLLLFTAGLLSKPMVVTLPFVLLLLDWWPLKRLSARSGSRRVFLEKLPLLLISGLFSLVALTVTTSGPASTLKAPAFSWRIGNAFVSYAVYIRQMFFPCGLAMPYPQYRLTVVSVGISVLLLAAVSAAVFRMRKKNPYLLFGWLWYLGMLLPVSGVLHFLGAARADRFTYLPQIGLYILIAWAVAEWPSKRRCRRAVLAAAAVAVLTALSVAAYIQAGYWKSSLALWTHTLKYTASNTIAHNNMGVVLGEKGRFSDAAEQFYKSLEIDRNDTDAWFNLGVIMIRCGRFAEAQACFERTLVICPDYVKAYKALGGTLILQGKYEPGIMWTRKFLETHPEDADARKNIAAALSQSGSAGNPGGTAP
ncbi:MAG: tetratricopeptide repeat protein [Kiritimatiellales bacterium]